MTTEEKRILSPDEQEQIFQVRTLVLSLDRFTRSQRLYPENNPTFIQHQESLFNEFNNYLSRHNELLLTITSDSFLFSKEVVYNNTDQRESFAFQLYNEGIRSLVFQQGITQEELMAFCKLLNTATVAEANDPTEPMVWEMEFEHIAYAIAEFVIDDGEYDIENRASELLDPEMNGYTGPTASGPPEDIEEGVNKAELVEQNKFSTMAKQACVLENHEIEQIQREIAQGERHERLRMDLFDMMMTLILDEKDDQDLEGYYRTLIKIVDATILDGRLDIGGKLLWSLRNLLKGEGGDFAIRRPERIELFLNTIGSKKRIVTYLNSLNLGYKGSVKDIVNFFTAMPQSAFPTMLAALNSINSPQIRKEVSIAVAHLYDQNIANFEVAFRRIKDPAHLVDVLLVLSHTRDARAITLMEPLLRHSHRSVRMAAINSIRDLGGDGSVRQLLPLLEDDAAEIRLHTLKALANCDDRTIGRLLLEKIRSEIFEKLEISEKRAYFFATSKLLGEDFIPYLEKTLKKGNLLKRAHITSMQQCAAFGLGVIASPKAVDLLENLEKNGHKQVRLDCAKELRKLHGAA